MRFSRLRAVLVLLATVLAVMSCGVRIDDAPREIAVENLPPELRPGQLPTPQRASASGPGSEQVYMVQDGTRLVTVERQIVDSPEQLLDILLLGTFPEERAEGIATAIFRGTRIQGVEVKPLIDLAIVDLAPGSLNPQQNSEQRLAFAQIVYTLTSLPGIQAVQFVQTDPDNLDAGPIDLAVQTDNGTTLPGTRVTRDDFALLSPDIVAQPAFDIPIATPTPVRDPDAPPTFDLPVWMLDSEDRLVRVSRRIEASPEALLVAVIGGPTAEERESLMLRSAIPPDALPNSITISNFDVEREDEFGFTVLQNLEIAIIDFSAGSLPPISDDNERLLAAAQIVFTMTELEDIIDQVVFSVDGEFIPNPIDDGVTLPFDPNIARGLDRSDYQTVLLRPDEPGTIPQAPVSGTPTPTPVPVPGATAAPEPTPTPGS